MTDHSTRFLEPRQGSARGRRSSNLLHTACHISLSLSLSLSPAIQHVQTRPAPATKSSSTAPPGCSRSAASRTVQSSLVVSSPRLSISLSNHAYARLNRRAIRVTQHKPRGWRRATVVGVPHCLPAATRKSIPYRLPINGACSACLTHARRSESYHASGAWQIRHL